MPSHSIKREGNRLDLVAQLVENERAKALRIHCEKVAQSTCRTSIIEILLEHPLGDLITKYQNTIIRNHDDPLTSSNPSNSL